MMLKHFITLQWKSATRAASFKTDVWFKVLMLFGALYIIGMFLMLGVFTYKIIEETQLGDPLRVVNQFLVYYWAFDLAFRIMLQKMPITNIKPLLYLPLKKNQIVQYSLGKTIVSFFNWSHAFVFVPFSVVLYLNGYPIGNILSWHIALMGLIYCNNFIYVLTNTRDNLFYAFFGLFVLAGVSQYYQWFDITQYTKPIFDLFYDVSWTASLPWLVTLILYVVTFQYFRKRMFLDAGLAVKQTQAKTEDLAWLNGLGNLGTFLKNDIKLLKRNKRSRTTLIMSVVFLFYGLLFFTGGVESYDNPYMKLFAGIFVTGGFLFTFGQFVPSWDSAYYPLMMSQNIKYKEYLNSKWVLVVVASFLSTILGSFYLYFGWSAFLAVIVSGIYNMGVNSYLVLWGGAYIKTPIDLTSAKGAFGDKQAFNTKTLLLTIPKLLLPIAIYFIGEITYGPNLGYALVAVTGLLGFVFKNTVFRIIERVYKKEKYKTLLAYKQKK